MRFQNGEPIIGLLLLSRGRFHLFLLAAPCLLLSGWSFFSFLYDQPWRRDNNYILPRLKKHPMVSLFFPFLDHWVFSLPQGINLLSFSTLGLTNRYILRRENGREREKDGLVEERRRKQTSGLNRGTSFLSSAPCRGFHQTFVSSSRPIHHQHHISFRKREEREMKCQLVWMAVRV